MRNENIPAYPELNPITLLEAVDANHVRSVIRVDGRETLPLATMSKAVSVICNETGRYLIYRSDERGFHNPAKTWNQPTVDVAVVGDSFAQGDCVPSSTNSVALIREKLPATLNLGVGGNGPLLELATLTEYLTHIRPRLVLWFYYEGNDLLDLEIERRSPLLMRYLGDGFSQNLMARQPALNDAIRDYFDRGMAEDDLARHSVSFTFTDVLFLRNLRNKLAQAIGNEMRPTFDDRARFELLGEVLAAAKRRTEAWSGRLVLVYLPTRWTSLPESMQAKQARSRARVLATVRSLDIPVIDVSADFRAHPDPASLFVFPEMGHYNERGYRFVADRVLTRLSAMASAERPRAGSERAAVRHDRAPAEPAPEDGQSHRGSLASH
jgi:hypothetical protein